MYKLTVGLPLFRARHVAWLALESLCRQTNIDFEWELVIAEEYRKRHLSLKEKNILRYRDRLAEVGCRNIIYIPIREWIPLFHKWKIIAEQSDSQGFILQAADCYSSPNRLKETSLLFDKGADWVQSPIHVLYNIIDEKIVLFKHNPSKHPCGAEMAVRTDLVKQIPFKNIIKGVDYYLFYECQKIKGKKLEVMCDNTDNWKYTLNVNGLNNISAGRQKKHFNRNEKSEHDIEKYIPADILEKLKTLKELTKGWKFRQFG